MKFSWRRTLLALMLASAWALPVAGAQDAAPEQPVPMAYAEPAPAAPVLSAPLPEEAPKTAANALYVEALGNAGMYSLNYERLFLRQVALRVGFSFVTMGASASSGGSTVSSRVSLLMIPVMANYIGIGNERHHLELGGGIVLANVSGSSTSGTASVSGSGFGVLGTVTTGYRYQPLSGGFLFRAGFTPFFGRGGFQAWGGFSLGGAF